MVQFWLLKRSKSSVSSMKSITVALTFVTLVAPLSVFAEEASSSCKDHCASEFSEDFHSACFSGCKINALKVEAGDLELCRLICKITTGSNIHIAACEVGCEFSDKSKAENSFSPEKLQKIFERMKNLPTSPCGSAGECPGGVGKEIYIQPSFESAPLIFENGFPSQ